MKNFGNIKAGDVVHYCTIQDSTIIQDCVGGIIFDGYVSSVTRCSNTTGITIRKMRFKVNEGYVKDEEDKCRITKNETVFAADGATLIVVDEGDSQHDELLMKKKIIISTSKKAIAEKLLEILEDNKKKVDKMAALCSKAKCMNESMMMSASIRLNMAKYEEEERELTEEEFACIAL
jgi:hypothetical protein